ncbi:MAG: tRNA threonylcarbamoyladenosine dehydratase [Bacteroidales bacterium]|nr:tRNA threonylcarbamoyladenosine dehydratase [Bacteroidales bacterium]MBQ9172219.1 tRNA threonylcarbamoyladenosine dehydratase [Bacteroidales bacterium]MBQ9711899.1 tRNA threonylcarbamoyladenosine dehydratase [Bacteroidales bacterium]MBR1433592.1 tRNA threonylcarbamoyladenosine dehydratase [Bacteroidales bacterium]MBR6415824.1 tRNA threonylcarbamoyladenosine dehydratase [Bacteroidales bacterium]
MDFSGKEIFSRTERLVGTPMMKALSETRVIIFGVGGVGSWCAEGLIRNGIGHLTMVDSDRVSVSNVNRQLMATTKTVGRVKVEALKERLLEINPDADIVAIQDIFSAENAASFHLEEYDYIIDAIDSLKDKATLIMEACRTRAGFFSSMGAALKVDPTMIKVAEFWNVRGCPLGAALRKKIKRSGVLPAKKFLCVYDEEVLENKGATPVPSALSPSPLTEGREDLADHDWTDSKAVVNGTLSHITAIFGFTLCGLVMKDIWKKFR